MSDFVAAKTFTFTPRKNIYFSVQQKNYVFAPRKKKFAAPPQKFCFAPQNLRAKTRKICGGTQNFVLRRKICAQKRAKPRKRVCVSRRKKCGIARKKKFCAANCAICAEAKIPENGNPTTASAFQPSREEILLWRVLEREFQAQAPGRRSQPSS